MKVIMVMLSTLNGKITRGDDPDIYKWTSREDQDYFFALLQKNNLLVMGSKTFEVAEKRIQLDNKRLQIVLTHKPDVYKSLAVPGQLEFSSESPADLVERFRERGYKRMLLLGGGEVNIAFLKDKLVDELYLTLEPKLFGHGKPFLSEGDFDVSLRYKTLSKLNSQGTLLIKYKIEK